MKLVTQQFDRGFWTVYSMCQNPNAGVSLAPVVMPVEARHAGLMLVMQACGLAVTPTQGRRNKWTQHVVKARDLT